jgi:uncharacterized protein YaiI (UPF0178 family)
MKKLLAVLIVSSSGILTYAHGPDYQKTNIKNHPRVNRVNKRIDNQGKNEMRKIGDGHLTKTDQKVLNRHLNQNSRIIGY